jgi:hypothetical protein
MVYSSKVSDKCVKMRKLWFHGHILNFNVINELSIVQTFYQLYMPNCILPHVGDTLVGKYGPASYGIKYVETPILKFSL